jgi:6-pyruvoyltetrahydropterin/6-carboxytetrahydropterin synthase
MFTVSIETEFSAAHIIRGYNGACSRQHGHNWKVTVEATSKKLDNLGMSVDFYVLQKTTEEVLAQLDHHDLNTVPPFDHELNPTSENLARYIYQQLQHRLPAHVTISSVTIGETSKYSAKYSEE